MVAFHVGDKAAPTPRAGGEDSEYNEKLVASLMQREVRS